jgi:hypothetical protein
MWRRRGHWTCPQHARRPRRAACYDVLERSLGEVRRFFREDERRFENYELKGPTAQRMRAEARVLGMREVVLAVADRHGAVGEELRARVQSCVDEEQLRELAVELANAADREAVEALLARTLPAS